MDTSGPQGSAAGAGTAPAQGPAPSDDEEENREALPGVSPSVPSGTILTPTQAQSAVDTLSNQMTHNLGVGSPTKSLTDVLGPNTRVTNLVHVASVQSMVVTGIAPQATGPSTGGALGGPSSTQTLSGGTAVAAQQPSAFSPTSPGGLRNAIDAEAPLAHEETIGSLHDSTFGDQGSSHTLNADRQLDIDDDDLLNQSVEDVLDGEEEQLGNKENPEPVPQPPEDENEDGAEDSGPEQDPRDDYQDYGRFP